MLSPKAVAAVVFIWVVAAVIGGFYEMSSVGSTEQSLLKTVLFYQIVTTEGTIGTTETVAGAVGYMQAIWELSTFQFSFVTGEWEYIRWIIFTPLTAYVVFGLVMTVVGILRGTVGSS